MNPAPKKVRERKETKQCTKCLEIKPIDCFARKRAQCKDCLKILNRLSHKVNYSSAVQRAYTLRRKARGSTRRSSLRMSKLYPEKWSARYAVKTALRNGSLKRLPCRDCGAMPTEGHHPDYSKPLEVIWLCKKHHYDIHRKPVPTFMLPYVRGPKIIRPKTAKHA